MRFFSSLTHMLSRALYGTPAMIGTTVIGVLISVVSFAAPFVRKASQKGWRGVKKDWTSEARYGAAVTAVVWGILFLSSIVGTVFADHITLVDQTRKAANEVDQLTALLHPNIRVFEEAPQNWRDVRGAQYPPKTRRIQLIDPPQLAARVGEVQEMNPCVMAPLGESLERVDLFLTFEPGIEIADFVERPKEGWSRNNDGSYSEHIGDINRGECINSWFVVKIRIATLGPHRVTYRIATRNTAPIEGGFSLVAIPPS